MTKDMTSGAITPLLIKFTIPLVLGNLFQLTYNAADSIIVGKFVGEDALAAVGTSNPLMTLAILFINGMCLGAGILVSTAFGAGDTELVERQVSTTAIAGTVFSLTFSALCVLLADPLLRLLQVPAAILPIAVNYLRIVFAGLIFTFFYNFLAATMRALGDSKTPFWFLLFSTILNIVLDLFCILTLGWGVAGAAIATVFSQGLSALLCYIYMYRKFDILKTEPADRRFRSDLARQLLYMYIRSVKVFLYWCMEQDEIAPLKIKMVKAQETIKDVYTQEELCALIQPPKREDSFVVWRSWAIINFILGTAAREATVCEMQMQDISFDDRTIKFRHLLKAKKDGSMSYLVRVYNGRTQVHRSSRR